MDTGSGSWTRARAHGHGLRYMDSGTWSSVHGLRDMVLRYMDLSLMVMDLSLMVMDLSLIDCPAWPH